MERMEQANRMKDMGTLNGEEDDSNVLNKDRILFSRLQNQTLQSINNTSDPIQSNPIPPSQSL
jgi:hypothetical protein